MINGTKPLTQRPKKKFHKHFGGTAIVNIPDFNLDKGMWMPNQDEDNAPTECVGYTVADIMTDISGIIQTPDFSYANALVIEGVQPTDAGVDFHAGMQGLVVFGSLNKALASFTAQSMGEEYVANFANWNAQQKKIASNKAQNGTYDALGNGDDFSSILSCLATGKISVSIGTPWFPEWEDVTSDGLLPMPNLNVDTNSLPWHNWALKGKKTTDQARLIGKSWQGSNFGDKGFHYISQDILNAVLNIPGTGAIAISPNGSRIYSLLGIFLQHLPLVTYLLTNQ